jgi:SAM-dependent methyltransferase
MTLLGRLHGGLVLGRRVVVLAERLAGLVPPEAKLLDLGCGDGRVSAAIRTARPDVDVRGADLLVREGTPIPVDRIEGERLPYESGSFDVVMMVDVLHHTTDPTSVLREASRVSRGFVLLKDHLSDPWLATVRLRLMDFAGNAHHGVALTYNYWKRDRWRAAFVEARLTEEIWIERLALYPWPVASLFGDGLHFVARLRRA